MNFIDSIKEKIAGKSIRIVFPEGEDERIQWAAKKLQEEGLVQPILIGYRSEIQKTAEEQGIDISNIHVIELGTFEATERLVDQFVERRKGKIDPTRARALLKDPNYLGTMLVHDGFADGMVSGAIHTTGDTVRPALQIIKTRDEFKRVSGLFIMMKEDKMYLMADCAINTEIDAETMAEIAVATDYSGRQFGFDPHIGMLSFSTKGSAKSDTVDMVYEATQMVKEKHPDIKIDGELQFDAAIDPDVSKRKAPASDVAGQVNAFVFPNLECGNIAYKVAQYLGDYTAVGPILQGLNKPVNDLSRGCRKEEVYQLALITAAQSCL
ncbi:MAG: phosphate acetyltransferase [Tissierellia bacterium]|nr:phosphate acetyltransferase [Tissierellia bacterium]